MPCSDTVTVTMTPLFQVGDLTTDLISGDSKKVRRLVFFPDALMKF
jgi:hypothetical protein